MMRSLANFIRTLHRDIAGSVVVETAIVAPVLVTLGLGAYDASRMVARHSDLQAGSTDVEGIVLAVSGGTATDTTKIKTAPMNSLSLPSNKVSVSKVYRCNAESSLSSTDDCDDNHVTATYVQITLTDSYTPTWVKFGIGSAINYSVVRTIQVS